MRGFEFGARTQMQLIEGVGAEVGQRVTLEPGPQIFDRVELGRVGGQTLDNDFPIGRIHVVANQEAAVRLGPIPNDQQPSPMVRPQGLQKLDDLLFFDRAIVQPEGDTVRWRPATIDT